MQILSRSFYILPPQIVAPNLLGKIVLREIDGSKMLGRIIETESYLAFNDPASHSYIGKTMRTEVLFGEAGHAYVHSIHRYHCMDIVTEGRDVPGSVLLRAIIPIAGIEGKTDGPGKLCMALQITKAQNGVDVTNPDSGLYVVDDGYKVDETKIIKSSRVGISTAKDLLLRFRIKLN